MSTSRITLLLESVLGKSKPTSKDNVSFYCPFCHHTKRKLDYFSFFLLVIYLL